MSKPAPRLSLIGFDADARMKALDSLADGIWILDPEAEPRYANPAAVAMQSMQWSSTGRTGTVYELVFRHAPVELEEADPVWTGEFHLGSAGSDVLSVVMQVRPLEDAAGRLLGYCCHARDISSEWRREQALQDRNVELEAAYAQLRQTQNQLMQSEKMASIGQLAAGVAHEINNPIGYVQSNLSSLQNYVRSLFTLLQAMEEQLQQTADRQGMTRVEALKERLDYDFLAQDLPQLLDESRTGIERVRKIVSDLRDFSHGGQDEAWVLADLHRGLDSAINIVWNDLKYKVRLERKLCGDLPAIECLPSQLNQVFLNLLINAGHAITGHGVITLESGFDETAVWIRISDDGCGISEANIQRIFDPFFTTKSVGSGTGLGLALSYGIVRKHRGRITVHSAPGQGATFTVWLPRSPDISLQEPA